MYVFYIRAIAARYIMCFGKVAGAPLVPFEYREWDEL